MGMSRNLLAILLSELKTVRVICRHTTPANRECGGVVEVPIEDLARVRACPLCKLELLRGGPEDHARFLVQAVHDLLAQPTATIEFVLPAKETP